MTGSGGCGVRPGLSTSLRANGSRECAPDDWLREAIHRAICGGMDCFVASFLAMTPGHDLAFSPRVAPEVCWKLFALDGQRAQGRPGARCTRGLVCNVHMLCR